MSTPNATPRPQKLVRVSRTTPARHVYQPATFYKWSHTGKYPELFIKFGGGLFLDEDALDRLLQRLQSGVANAR